MRERTEDPMRILLMGDFSGAGSGVTRERTDLHKRAPVMVDVDNFDKALSRFAPRLELRLGRAGSDPGATEVVEFKEIADFHPDSLYRRLSPFKVLRDLRERLQNPATFAAAAADFKRGFEAESHAETRDAANQDQGGAMNEDDADTLQRLLGTSRGPAPKSSANPAGLSIDTTELIRQVVAPHIVPDAPQFQAQYVSSIESAIGDRIRAILHDPQFQALEALWRGASWLVSNVETGEELQLYLLDVSTSDIRQDIEAAQGNVESTALYKLLVEHARGTPGAEPWSLIVGNYSFGIQEDDLHLLGSLAAIASQAGAPFLAAAEPNLTGSATLAASPDPADWNAPTGEPLERWTRLRASSVAPWIGLTLPRILLRLPYGKNTEPVEQLDFEEMPDPQHENFLWGNGALGCALLIARAFMQRGWDMEPGDELDIEDLPAYTFTEDGEKKLMPCAEANLGERAGEALLNSGLIPLLSYKNRNAVRVMRFQSIAHPPRPLPGSWRAV